MTEVYLRTRNTIIDDIMEVGFMKLGMTKSEASILTFIIFFLVAALVFFLKYKPAIISFFTKNKTKTNSQNTIKTPTANNTNIKKDGNMQDSENNILDYVNGSENSNENSENKYMARSSIPSDKTNNENNGPNIKKLIIILIVFVIITALGILIYQGVTHTEKEDQGIVTGISLKGVPLNLNKTNLSEITPQYPVYENVTDFMNARATRGLVKDNSGVNAEITQSYYLYDNNDTQADIKAEQERINRNEHNPYHDLAEPLLDANGQYIPKEVEVEGILYFDANGTLKQITIDYQNRHKSYLALQNAKESSTSYSVDRVKANKLLSAIDNSSYEEKQAQYHKMKVNEIASTVSANTHDAECFATEGELVVVKPKDLTNHIIEPDNFFQIRIEYYEQDGRVYV